MRFLPFFDGKPTPPTWSLAYLRYVRIVAIDNALLLVDRAPRPGKWRRLAEEQAARIVELERELLDAETRGRLKARIDAAQWCEAFATPTATHNPRPAERKAYRAVGRQLARIPVREG